MPYVKIINRTNNRVRLPGTHKSIAPKSFVYLTGAEFQRARPTLLTLRDRDIVAFDDRQPIEVLAPPRVKATVVSRSVNTPPANPAPFDAYIVPAGASGDWYGQDNKIAIFDGTKWTFHTPFDGLCIYVEDEGTFVTFTGGDLRDDEDLDGKIGWVAAIDEDATQT